MNWFPQTGAGSIIQFPIKRTRTWRSIRNEVESGERILLPDPASGQIEWRLSYKDLSDDEATLLNGLFLTSQGSYKPFGFVDPMANLLAWSEDLSKPDWQAGLLTKTGGVSDPLGTKHAWTLINGTPGDLPLSQTVAVPGDYMACFSVWVRSEAAGSITLQRDGTQSSSTIGPVWKRVVVSGTGVEGASNSTVSVVVGAGLTVQIFGLQFEPQPYASQYKSSSAATGIYDETYFGADRLEIVSTGPGLSACEVTLLSRV